MDPATAVLRAFPAGVPKSRALRAHTKRDDAAGPGGKDQAPGVVLAVSKPMNEAYDLVARLAPTDVTVTLTGETGTGKDVFAHLVHNTSRRATRPFVVFDCGAVPPNLVESELFGHERGAFTGAHAEH